MTEVSFWTVEKIAVEISAKATRPSQCRKRTVLPILQGDFGGALLCRIKKAPKNPIFWPKVAKSCK
jgi:hypothetical protein